MTTAPPDLWRAQGGRRPHVLWDKVAGPTPRGVLGIGDPDVHLVDGRWTLFLGGFSTTFRNRLYRAILADGGTLAAGPWQLDRDRRGRAAALAPDPPSAGWDGAGMHTPSYVPPMAGRPARIYYTGRSTRRHYGPGSRYAIGVLEHRDGRWHPTRPPCPGRRGAADQRAGALRDPHRGPLANVVPDQPSRGRPR